MKNIQLKFSEKKIKSWIHLWTSAFSAGFVLTNFISVTIMIKFIDIFSDNLSVAQLDQLHHLTDYRYLLDTLVGFVFLACVTAIKLVIDKIREND